ncbi:hypothetical protein [Homoserinibacter sp. GY 40078]|uniref:hypothetical protein n=1 Tax=Homoserinibacter sp. GY 40078 TaxID=2603275 RepID=UPI0011CACE3E|nr:hypothetical protein [Homoserinibacter sp. GY 40078]TXK19726.1 hypothetical protein FVQ89_07630 [Homoserinibacter sp. GY 40078]
MSIVANSRDTSLARDALITAAWVAAVLLVISFADFLFSSIPWVFASAYWPQGGGLGGGLYDVAGPSVASLLGGTVQGFLAGIAVQIIPFAVGVFLSLWLLLPLRQADGIMQIALRGLVASLAGAVLATLVSLIVQLGTGSWPALLPNAIGFVALAVRNAPVVLLVIVVRRFVPLRARA